MAAMRTNSTFAAAARMAAFETVKQTVVFACIKKRGILTVCLTKAVGYTSYKTNASALRTFANRGHLTTAMTKVQRESAPQRSYKV